jgi:hypothetical protein
MKKECPAFRDEANSGLLRLKETSSDLKELLLFLLTLPLNVVPVVGTIAFVGINGYLTGPFIHSRYKHPTL